MKTPSLGTDSIEEITVIEETAVPLEHQVGQIIHSSDVIIQVAARKAELDNISVR